MLQCMTINIAINFDIQNQFFLIKNRIFLLINRSRKNLSKRSIDQILNFKLKT